MLRSPAVGVGLRLKQRSLEAPSLLGALEVGHTSLLSSVELSTSNSCVPIPRCTVESLTPRCAQRSGMKCSSRMFMIFYRACLSSRRIETRFTRRPAPSSLVLLAREAESFLEVLLFPEFQQGTTQETNMRGALPLCLRKPGVWPLPLRETFRA